MALRGTDPEPSITEYVEEYKDYWFEWLIVMGVSRGSRRG
jgi:hypothetical protein